jgi:hypothetical protein
LAQRPKHCAVHTDNPTHVCRLFQPWYLLCCYKKLRLDLNMLLPR